MATVAHVPRYVLLVLLGLYLGAGRIAVTAGRKPESPEAGKRELLRRVYSAEIGVQEATGRNDGARVEEYLRYCNLGEGHAWCAAFVSWCFGQAGYDQPRNPWSPALFPASRVIWSAAGGHTRPEHNSRKPPQTGDVFGIYYPALKRIAHAGFVDKPDGDWIITVEGNAENSVRRKRRHLQTVHAVADWLSANVIH